MFTSDEAATTAMAASRDSVRQGFGTPVGIIEDRRRPAAPTSVLDPLTIARAVWNAKRLILATTVLGIVCAVVYALVTPKIYAATTQILIDPRDIKVVANEVTPNALPSEATLALIESQTSVILSSNILSRVIADAGLDKDTEFNGESRTGLAALLPAAFTDLFAGEAADPREREYRIMARLRRALTVGRETKSFVINLSVDSRDPEKSARLANMTAGIFLDEQGRVQSETARRATTALSSRLSELRQSVVEAEGAVEDYKSRNALVGVGGRLVDDQYITRINDELARVRGDIPALRVKAESMRGASVEDVVRGTLPEELSSEALVRLRQTYSDLEQQAAVLAARLGPRHPQRIASEGALTAARQAISSELSRIVSSAQTELARADETERNLTGQIAELKDKQIETSGSFVKLRELEREVDASRAVYEAFLLRARETGEQESLNTANVRIISAATPPIDPAGISRKVVVAAGGIAGFGLGVGLAALLSILKSTRAAFAGDRRRNLDGPWPAPSAGSGSAAIGQDGSNTSLAGSGAEQRHPSPAGDLRPAVYDLDGSRTFLRQRAAAGAEADGEQIDRAYAERTERLAELDARLATYDESRGGGREANADDAELDRPATAGGNAQDETMRGGPSLTTIGGDDADRPATASGRASPDLDLSLAQAARGATSPASPDRLSLRERVKALSDARPETQAEPKRGVDPDVAVLRDEIQTVKQAIADIRRRRETQSTAQ